MKLMKHRVLVAMIVLIGSMLSACDTPYRANIDYMYSEQIIWPGPPEKPRIKYLWSLHSLLPEGKKVTDYVFGSLSETDSLAVMPYIGRPNGLWVHGNEKLYIVDQGGPRITVVNLHTFDVQHFGFEGRGELVMPIGVAVSNDGSVYVTDSQEGTVVKYDNKGHFAGYLGEEGLFKRPTGITIDVRTGKIFVIDTAAHKVYVFGGDGRLEFEFGRRGSQDGEFNYPSHIASGSDGKIHINDAMNFRIQVFDENGGFISKFGRLGDSYADLERPKGVAVDTFGNIYVVDVAQDTVKIFNNEGKLLLFFGESGRAPGKFIAPTGIFINDRNQIFVADSYNMRIQVFKLLE